jgi:hypothetical protein
MGWHSDNAFDWYLQGSRFDSDGGTVVLTNAFRTRSKRSRATTASMEILLSSLFICYLIILLTASSNNQLKTISYEKCRNIASPVTECIQSDRICSE